jgi:uncharacterized membrane protein YfcA
MSDEVSRAGGLIGTALGVLAFNAIRRAGQLDALIMLSYLVLFVAIGGMMLFESLKAMLIARAGAPVRLERAGQHPVWLKLPWRVRFYRSKLYASVWPILGFAALVGFIGAVLGIGGGFIMVPALLYLFRVPTAVVVGTSLFQILTTMTAATLFHAASNQSVDIVLAILLIIGGVVGLAGGLFGAFRQHILHPGHQRLHSEPVLLAQVVHRAGVFDELVRPADAHHGNRDACRSQMLHDSTAKAIVKHMIFKGADHFHFPSE